MILQLVNGYTKGDGVGNVISAINGILEKQGYATKIVNRTLTFSDIYSSDFNEENTVLYHVAVDVDPIVAYLRCKKVLVFHNITDPGLLEGPGLVQIRTKCAAGLYDISRLSKYFCCAIVFSEYSKEVLVENGWPEDKIFSIPIMIRFDKLMHNYNSKIIEKYKDGKTNILFTGRVFPNKKQDEIISVFAEYREKYNKNSRLIIVGGIGNQQYYELMNKQIDNLGLKGCVVITGKVPIADYLAFYYVADVYLCMSAHEGFCIPLVEAMYFKIPIVAIRSTAVTSTLDGAGILLDERRTDSIADAINNLTADNQLRDEIIHGEQKRLEELLPERLEVRYIELLRECLAYSNNGGSYKQLPDNFNLYNEICIPDAIMANNIGIVIYGMGTMGCKVYTALKKNGIKPLCACDLGKAGSIEEGLTVISPEEAMDLYKESIFVISVQDRKNVKDILKNLISHGVLMEHIYVYDNDFERII